MVGPADIREDLIPSSATSNQEGSAHRLGASCWAVGSGLCLHLTTGAGTCRGRRLPPRSSRNDGPHRPVKTESCENRFASPSAPTGPTMSKEKSETLLMQTPLLSNSHAFLVKKRPGPPANQNQTDAAAKTIACFPFRSPLLPQAGGSVPTRKGRAVEGAIFAVQGGVSGSIEDAPRRKVLLVMPPQLGLLGGPSALVGLAGETSDTLVLVDWDRSE